MKVSELRNYGVAFSDAESSWSPEVKLRLRQRAEAVLKRSLSRWQKLRFAVAFVRGKRRAARLDLSDLHARGMTNAAFLDQQRAYLAMFWALVRVLGSEGALKVMYQVMDATAPEALGLLLPDPGDVRRVGDDPLAVFRAYYRESPEAAARAGCNEIRIAEDTDDALQFDVHWCLWFELAQRMGVPEACRPNCYADDLVLPDYFAAFDIEYKRSNTLACGGTCCDFRFERKASGRPQDRPPAGAGVPHDPESVLHTDDDDTPDA